MKRDHLIEIQNSLVKYFNNEQFLERTSLKENDLLPYIENTAFIVELSILYENTERTCQDVLNLCKLVLMDLFMDEPSQGWLEYTYQYTLNKSFPHLGIDLDELDKKEVSILVFLAFLRVIFDADREISKLNHEHNFLILDLLSKEEVNQLYNPVEYRRFLKAFHEQYVYEMMRLHQELTHHNTHDHISVVHYIALNIGRQLFKAGIPVDLGRVSGSAAGHDIGKFACTGEEIQRIPYLHYYYTDVWFKKNNISHIGHVAVNHSTWDLELENLPLESLILIYADFRAKNKIEDDKKIMTIYSLEESFDVILQKLDNVDEAKANRYKKVYNKLLDFENYVKHLGVNVDVLSDEREEKVEKNVTLMHGHEIVEYLKHKAIEHNIYLMFKLRSETALSSMIEFAKSRSSWNILRSNLNILGEYSTYFTQKQKLITLNYLCDLLLYHEEDVRDKAAELIGIIIAIFDEEYRKEVPPNSTLEQPETTSFQLFDKYLQLIIHPDHKIIDSHKERLGQCLRIIINALFKKAKPEYIPQYRAIVIQYLSDIPKEDLNTMLNLLQTIKFIPWTGSSLKTVNVLADILLESLKSDSNDIRLIVLDRIELLLDFFPYRSFKAKIINAFNSFYQESPSITEKYIRCRIARKIQLCDSSEDWFSTCFIDKSDNISDIFLRNLKSATSWISKKFHIQLMLDYTSNAAQGDALYTAMHFCNLIKVSSKENVRINAGKALLKIVLQLSPEQRNEIAIELLRALEIEGFEHGAYIPEYLGQILLYLDPNDLNEQLDELYFKIKRVSKQTTFLILNTIGTTIEHYPVYKNVFSEPDDVYLKRLEYMLGMLLVGCSNYDDDVKQEAFTVIGNIFASDLLTLQEKNWVFDILAKKVLVLIPEKDVNEMLFINNAASLNHIYRFISDYTHKYGPIELPMPKKIAFFPGTFDPFSLSHKEIAVEIRNLGFEVFLAVDEFSWSKSAQPHLQRQNIINMSIADEKNMYIFPEEIPINIANPNDMKKLRSIFEGYNVHVAVGSDVIINASSYKQKNAPHSIHSFPHIIFKRQYSPEEQPLILLYETAKEQIIDVIELYLPNQYNMIRSSLIRECIDENRDISDLIDPQVQKYIYEYGLYLREPQFKTLIESHAISLKTITSPTKKFVKELCDAMFEDNRKGFDVIYDLVKHKKASVTVMYSTTTQLEFLGFSVFHGVSSSSLYSEFKNHNISEHIRRHSVGRMIVIDGIFTRDFAPDNTAQMILSEALSHCLSNDYTYAVYKCALNEMCVENIYSTLMNQGFKEISEENGFKIFDVIMSRPCILNLDVLTFIKEPFRSNEKVIAAVKRARNRLQKALTQLFPGHLVLSFEREALYQSLVDKICSTNGVSTESLVPRQLGPYMCAPFGQILKGHIVPNTVTKSLHTEKVYYPDASKFFIEQYPTYLPLENQIKTIRSFNRPVILVDDILNKGYRIKALDPILKNEEIEVKKIIVGILSSRGKELMDIQGREVDSAYFIPNLKNWFTEATMYPFIGGDSAWAGSSPIKYLLPSINMILPYVSPYFIRGASEASLVNLSRVCIENAMSILSVLEKEYQTFQERSLTLRHLGEVIVFPRCIDKGNGVHYDYNQKASSYLQNDLEHLSRISRINE